MRRDEFAAFYVANKDRCWQAAVAGGMGSDRAEDAVAEAFSRAWARWRTVREYQSPAAWVVRTAMNSDISWWRKRRHEVALNVLPEGPAAVHTDGLDLLAAIRGLPPRQREVVVFRYLLDLDTATTAGEMRIAPGTVTAHLHRALATLREQLHEEPEPEGTHP